MFSVSVTYDRDTVRAWEWLRGEGITPVQILGNDAFDLAGRLGTGRSFHGPLTHLRLDVDQEYARPLRELDPPHVRETLERAVRHVLEECIPGAAGAINVRCEGPQADHCAYAVLLPKKEDEPGTRFLSRADIQALEAAWDRELQRAFGLRREVDRLGLPEDRLPSSPEVQRVRELDARWRHAVGQVREALGARMHGRIPQERLRAVVERAQELQDGLRGAREVLEGWSPMPVLETVRLKVERGAEYLARLPEAHVDRVLLEATREASGLDLREAASLRLIAYRSGPDLRLTVFLSDADRPPQPVDFQVLGERLQNRLAGELAHAGHQLHPLGRDATSVIGRIEVLGAQPPSRTAPEVSPVARPERAASGPPIVVEYHLARGLELSRLSPERQSEILDRAALRAFPFLNKDAPREIQAVSDGRALRVRITLPADGAWRGRELQSGRFEGRFANEVNRQLSLTPSRADLEPSLFVKEPASLGTPMNGGSHTHELRPEDKTFARQVCAKVLSGEADRDPKAFAAWVRKGLDDYRSRAPFGQALRQGLKEVGRGLDTPLSDVWARLCRAVPPPMRAAYVLTRTIGRIIPRE